MTNEYTQSNQLEFFCCLNGALYYNLTEIEDACTVLMGEINYIFKKY